MSLSDFSPATRDWFHGAFAEPTPAQAQAWPAIASGEHVLISAPTGSGKTLASFLWAIDRLAGDDDTDRERRIGLVYVSPLKALSYDIDRNLRTPLRGIGASLRVAVRTGDTPQRERQAMLREPPDILITTPESLYLMLTSRAQELFAGARWCIVDEIHAVAPTKRGAHLALTLERLTKAAGNEVQRIGLSATQKPLEEIGRFLVGPSRTCRIVDTGVRKELDLRIQVPVESMVEPDSTPAPDLDPLAGGSEATRRSIWPAIYPELLELIKAHRSTILFVNNRRGAERLALRLNELAGEDIARAHHGSLAREERTVVEEMLKAGELPCLVATSSLELGIDMGAVDLVIQVESPKSVARGLQRIGRAGHSVGDVSRGRIFPKFRADLLECAVVAKRMREGEIETTVVPRNALDVLAQQIVAIAAAAPEDQPVAVDDLHALVRRTHSYSELSRELARERARHARRPLSLLRVLGAAPADRLGPDRRHAPRAARRTAVGGHQRGHDPRPRPLRRHAARRPPGRRARRGDGLRGAARADIPARREHLADRGDRARPGDRDAGAGAARRGPVLEGRRHRAPQGAGRGDRRVRAVGGTAGARDARGRLRPGPARGGQPRRVPGASSNRRRAWCRPTERSWWSASATRSATGACACCRRSAAGSTRRGGWR